MWGEYVGEQISHCERKIEQQLQVIELDSTISKIVLLTRGPVYIEGEVELPYTLESFRSSALDNSKDNSYSAYAKGFENTIERLSNIPHVKEIYYYLENPELGFLPKEALPRPFDLLGVSLQGSTVKRDYYNLRMKKYKEVILEKSLRFEKLKIIDVEDIFCEGEDCLSL